MWWIRQAILQALAEQSRFVRVPPNRAGALHRIGRRASALQQELGREPTDTEIVEGMPEATPTAVMVQAARYRQLSLDAPVSPDNDTRLLDSLADEASASPDEHLLACARTEAVARALATLTAREARVLRLYFGLDGGEPMKLARIGVLLGVTRERVRQIREQAFARLRRQPDARRLASLVDREFVVSAPA